MTFHETLTFVVSSLDGISEMILLPVIGPSVSVTSGFFRVQLYDLASS